MYIEHPYFYEGNDKEKGQRGNTLSIISNQSTGAAMAAPFTEWRKQNGYRSRKNTYQ